MKKTYEKPMIYIESFKLSQDISAGCIYISEGPGEPIYDPEFDINIYVKGSCQYSGPNEDDGPCYDIPTIETKIYSS